MTLSGRSGVRPSSSMSSICAMFASWNSSTRMWRNWRCHRRRMLGRALNSCGDRGDLLAEVERAALRQLLLVGAVDRCDLGQPHDLQRRAILRRRCRPARRSLAGAPSANLLRGERLAGRRRSSGALRGRPPSRRIGVVLDLLAELFLAFVPAQPRVVAAHVADRAQVAVGDQAGGGIGVGAVSVLEDRSLAGDEGVEVVRRDQLVLGAVDELHEVRRTTSRAW